MKLWLLKNLSIKNSQGKKEDMGNYNLKSYSRWLFYPLNNLKFRRNFFLIEEWGQKSEESEEKEQLMLCFIFF